MLKLLLSELATVRVVCRGKIKVKTADGKGTEEAPCAGVFEMPLERLATAFRIGNRAEWACPFCELRYHLSGPAGGNINPFEPLVKAISDLALLQKRFEIEFVVKQKD